MCGIAGIASRAPIGWHPVHLLAHRGPDGQDEVAIDLRAGHVVLCHSRLAIVDLSHAGDQPMANEDGSLLMVFNGEIYNHEELRSRCIAAGHTFRSRMDGEVILHLWEMEGPACLNRLNGIFAVAIVDTRTSQVYLARDPLGVKPLFATEAKDGTLRFASEIAGLWELGAERGPLDVTALAQFLTFLWIPDPRTPYANVRSVEPGTYVRWHPVDGSRHHRYHRLEDEVDVERPPRDFATAMNELRAVLDAAVGRQLLGDVPIGVMASGGVDSSLIWSMAGENVGRAYTIQWDASGQDGLGEDADAVRLLEASIGTPVRYLPGSDAGVNSLPLGGDLFADPAFELTRFIAAAARDDRYKVLLSGQGGDEVFGGYRRHAVAAMLGFASIGGSGRAAAAALSRFGAGAHVEFAARGNGS